MWKVRVRRAGTFSARFNRAIDETSRESGLPREVVAPVLRGALALFAGSIVGVVAFVAMALATGKAAWLFLAPATITAALLAAGRRRP